MAPRRKWQMRRLQILRFRSPLIGRTSTSIEPGRLRGQMVSQKVSEIYSVRRTVLVFMRYWCS